MPSENSGAMVSQLLHLIARGHVVHFTGLKFSVRFGREQLKQHQIQISHLAVIEVDKKRFFVREVPRVLKEERFCIGGIGLLQLWPKFIPEFLRQRKQSNGGYRPQSLF